MNKIICIGSSAKDIFFPTSEGIVLDTPEDITSQKKISFESGAKYHIDDRFESLGGCAVNVACGLKRLDIDSFCYTVVGNDDAGEWIKQRIKKEGVNVDLITKEACPSGLSAIIVDKNSGERIIFSNQESNERMKVDVKKMEGFEWISVTDLAGEWQKILDDVFDFSKKSGSKVIFNPRGKNIKDDARKVWEMAGKSEIFFVNKDESIEILSASEEQLEKESLNDEVYLLKKLKETGMGIVVITDGTRGAWAYNGKKLVYAGAMEMNPVDTTGAGDAFSSGFMAAHINGKDLEECLKWGTANGGNSVNYYGGVEGLLRADKIEEKIESIGISNLN